MLKTVGAKLSVEKWNFIVLIHWQLDTMMLIICLCASFSALTLLVGWKQDRSSTSCGDSLLTLVMT